MIFDQNLAKAIYNLGSTLIHDDKADLGYFSYRNRHNHVYHGKKAPHHPSPFHHYQIGTLLCLVGQAMALGSLANDVMETAYDTPSENSYSETD